MRMTLCQLFVVFPRVQSWLSLKVTLLTGDTVFLCVGHLNKKKKLFANIHAKVASEKKSRIKFLCKLRLNIVLLYLVDEW